MPFKSYVGKYFIFFLKNESFKIFNSVGNNFVLQLDIKKLKNHSEDCLLDSPFPEQKLNIDRLCECYYFLLEKMVIFVKKYTNQLF